MRFLLVEFSPSGGLFQFSYQLGASLASQGHDVELLTGRQPELASRQPRFTVSGVLPTWHAGASTVEPSSLRRARRPMRAARHVLALAELIFYVHRQQPDVVMWHGTRFSIDSWALWLSRRASPSPMYGSIIHETRPLAEHRRSGGFYRTDPILMRSIARTINSLDLIFVLGDTARRDLLDYWQPRTSVEVIPHGDEGVFLTECEVPVVSATEQNVLFFGSWLRHKGIHILLDAFEQIRTSVPEATLTIAGAVGGDVDFYSIQARAIAVGHVTLRPGYVPIAEVPDLFGRARVVAVPYLRANQSGVIHLAETFGRPVVASAVGDIPSTVRHEFTGLVIPAGDASALADSLRWLLLHPEAAERLGTEGRRRVESEGSWRNIADMVSAAVERQAGQRGHMNDCAKTRTRVPTSSIYNRWRRLAGRLNRYGSRPEI